MAKEILVVDDSMSMRFFLKGFVKEKGYNFNEAINGLEGLEKFKKINPDITILDLTMPVMDGMEALGKMKEHNPDAKIWIMTADTQKKTHEDALALGAEAILKKPPVKEILFTIFDQ